MFNYAQEVKVAAKSPLTLPLGVIVAAKQGFSQTALMWVAAGGSVDATDTQGGDEMTMLMFASFYGRVRLVDKLIVSCKASIDFKVSPDQPSAIMIAVVQGHAAIVQRLCDAGSKDVLYAMAEADLHGRADIMSALSTHIKQVQASLWYEKGEKLHPAIVSAVIEGYEATVLAWLQGGGSVDATYDYIDKQIKDMTMLHFACVDNQPSMVSLLLKHGANTNVQNSDGVSPLMESAFHGHASTVSRL